MSTTLNTTDTSATNVEWCTLGDLAADQAILQKFILSRQQCMPPPRDTEIGNDSGNDSDNDSLCCNHYNEKEWIAEKLAEDEARWAAEDAEIVKQRKARWVAEYKAKKMAEFEAKIEAEVAKRMAECKAKTGWL